MVGIEPTTHALRKHCSTTKPHRRICSLCILMNFILHGKCIEIVYYLMMSLNFIQKKDVSLQFQSEEDVSSFRIEGINHELI